jgi:hypothetical protein
MTNTRPVIASGCIEDGKDISNLNFDDGACLQDSFVKTPEIMIMAVIKKMEMLFFNL